MTDDKKFRHDRFQVGDMVTLIPTDEYLGGPVQEGIWRKYGKGPFEVEAVEDLEKLWPGVENKSLHSQLVTICDGGERLSGYWLNPIEREEQSAA